MDAEVFARCGASLILIDISLGAARRTRVRARRYCISILSVVGNAQRLPRCDRSIAFAYVHGGLHHLRGPYPGVVEAARVARRAVSISEPAQAAATAIAIRLGLAPEQEEAGNRIGRMDPAETEALLARSGFRGELDERCATYYHQIPGRTIRLTSRGRLLPLAMRALQSVDRVAGGLGNKLTVQAVRNDELTFGVRAHPRAAFFDAPAASRRRELRCG